jgi:hypothetical protein
MSRFPSRASIRLGMLSAVVVGALISACDADLGYQNARTYSSQPPDVERDLFTFVGDTIDLRESVMAYDEPDRATCFSEDLSLATALNDTPVIVAGAPGEVAIQCVQTHQEESFVAEEPSREWTVATYRVRLHIQLREAEMPVDNQPADEPEATVRGR